MVCRNNVPSAEKQTQDAKSRGLRQSALKHTASSTLWVQVPDWFTQIGAHMTMLIAVDNANQIWAISTELEEADVAIAGTATSKEALELGN